MENVSKSHFELCVALEHHNSLRSYLREIIYSEKKKQKTVEIMQLTFALQRVSIFSGTWKCLLQPLRCFSAFENLWQGMANWLVFVSGWLVFGRVSLFHAANLQVESSFWSTTICVSW